MELDSILEKRRSIRAFRPKAVEPGKIRALLEAAVTGPSAGGLQAFRIISVTDSGRRALLAKESLDQEFVADAPVVLVFFADRTRSAGAYGPRGAERYSMQDATIACAYAQLRAVDLGLGSVWVGAFSDKGVAAAVGAPPDLLPVALLPVGYPADIPAPSSRRGFTALVRNEKF